MISEPYNSLKSMAMSRWGGWQLCVFVNGVELAHEGSVTAR